MINRLISGLMLCVCVIVGTVTPGVAQYMTSASIAASVYSPAAMTLQGSCSESAPPLSFGSMANCSEGWFGYSASVGSTASSSCDSNSAIGGCSLGAAAIVNNCTDEYWVGAISGVSNVDNYGVWVYAFVEWYGGNSISEYVESDVMCDGASWGYDDSTGNLSDYCPSGELFAYTY